MNLSRLCSLGLLKNGVQVCRPCQRSLPVLLRSYARKSTIDPNDAPMKFTESGAIYGIADIRRIQRDNTPWYQGIVCVGALAVFLLYFCILREENDIDLIFNKDLYETVDGLEIINLQVSRQFYLNSGDVSEVSKIDKRLKELGAKTEKSNG